MKNEKGLKTYNYESILKPIIFFLIGILLVSQENIIEAATYVIGIVLFLIGIIKIIIYYKKPEEKKDVLVGAGYMVVGVTLVLLTLLVPDIVRISFRYIISAFLLYTAIVRLIQAFKKPKNIKLLYLLSSILIIICAILIALLNINFHIVGIIIIVYSIIEIVGYILNNKYTEENGKISEAIVVREKEE